MSDPMKRLLYGQGNQHFLHACHSFQWDRTPDPLPHSYHTHQYSRNSSGTPWPEPRALRQDHPTTAFSGNHHPSRPAPKSTQRCRVCGSSEGVHSIKSYEMEIAQAYLGAAV